MSQSAVQDILKMIDGLSECLRATDSFHKAAVGPATSDNLGEVGPDENEKCEWILAILGGSAPLSNFDCASVLTEAMLLDNVAIRMGKLIE